MDRIIRNDASFEFYRASLSEATNKKGKGRSRSSASPHRLALGVPHHAGQVCELLQWMGEVLPGLPGFDPQKQRKLGEAIASLLLHMISLSESCGVDLGASIIAKMQLNALKYPALLVKGKAGKYVEYSHHTGIHQAGQRIGVLKGSKSVPWDNEVTVSNIIERLRFFVEERDWNRFHLPRNLLLAMMGEVGELSELMMTLSPDEKQWSVAERDECAQELADVCIYAIRFSDVCNLHLVQDLDGLVIAALAAKGEAIENESSAWEGGWLGKERSLWLLYLIPLSIVVSFTFVAFSQG